MTSTWPEQDAIDEWWQENSLALKEAASGYRIERDKQVEKQIVAAYKRGAEWFKENGDMPEFLEKAAWDYADKALYPNTNDN